MAVEAAATLGTHGAGTSRNDSGSVARAQIIAALAHRTDGVLRAVEHVLALIHRRPKVTQRCGVRSRTDGLVIYSAVRRRNSHRHPLVAVIKWRRGVGISIDHVSTGGGIGGKCPSCF